MSQILLSHASCLLYTISMPDSIFTKIIRGEIPAHRVYEDDHTLAFLTIQPVTLGHVLVVPKRQVDKFYDLSDGDYRALFETVKKVAKHMEVVFGQRTLLNVMGTDVPHVHVHLFPLDPEHPPKSDLPFADSDELAAVAEKLKMN